MYKFEKLLVWQKAMDLVEVLYRLQAKIPKVEQFGLLSQLRRAATSIPLNIAEGSNSTSDKSFCRYLKISRGSLYEVVTILKLLERLYQLEGGVELEACHVVGRLISGLLRYLKKSQPKTKD